MFLGGGTMDDNQLKLILNDPLLGPATHNPEVWLWCIIHEAEHVSEEKSSVLLLIHYFKVLFPIFQKIKKQPL